MSMLKGVPLSPLQVCEKISSFEWASWKLFIKYMSLHDDAKTTKCRQ